MTPSPELALCLGPLSLELAQGLARVGKTRILLFGA